MAVMLPREKWTDERLDDRKQEVDTALTRIETKLDEHSADFAHVDKRFDKLEGRFDKLMFALFGVGGSIIVTLIGLLGISLR
jgi:hypothetical protein